MKTKRISLAIISTLALACLGTGVATLNAQAADSDVFKTQAGASVKFMQDEKDSGIRFQYYLEDDYFDSLLNSEKTAWAENVEVGSIIIPYDLLSANYDVNNAYADASAENTKFEKALIPASKWKDDKTKEGVLTGYQTSYAYVYNLPSTEYERRLWAVGYVKTESGIAYTDTVIRSMGDVAYKALQAHYDGTNVLKDGQPEILEKYLVNHTCTVTVSDNGSAYDTFEVQYGKTLTETIALKDGYDYATYTSTDGTTYDFTAPIKSDVTINVDWWKGVSTAQEFMAMNATDNYVLERDIDFSGVSYTPIANFGGILEGNGYAVKNVTINLSDSDTDGTGLFDVLNGATVKNLEIHNATFNGNSAGNVYNSGFVVGTMTDSTVRDIILKDCVGGNVVAPTKDEIRGGAVAGLATNGKVYNIWIDVYNTSGWSIGVGHGTDYGRDNLFCLWTDEHTGEPGVWGSQTSTSYDVVTNGGYEGASNAEALLKRMGEEHNAYGLFSTWNTSGDYPTLNDKCSIETTYVAPTYNVTVTENGETVKTVSVSEGETLEQADLLKDGYDYGVYTVNGATFDFATEIYANTTVEAEYWKGVATPVEFMAMNDTDNYVLERDINFLGVAYTPVAKIGGILDGNGFAVYNVAMNPGSGSTGLILEVTGTVKNFGMESPYLGASTSATAQNGMLVQHLNGGTIVDSYVLNGVMGGTYKRAYSGQLVGKATNATLKNVVVDVVLTDGTASSISLLVGSGTWEAVNLCATIRDANDYSGCWCNPTAGSGNIGWNYFSSYGDDSASTCFKSKGLNTTVWGWDTTKVWQNNECSMDTTCDAVAATYTVTLKENSAIVKTVSVKDGDVLTESQLLKDGADYGFYSVDGRNVDLTAPIMSNVEITAEYWTGVATPQEFMAMNATDNYVLEQDIDFANVTYIPVNEIGGILDGNGYTIKNVTMTRGSEDGIAIIGTISGTVRNLETDNVILNSNSENNIGDSGILARMLTGTIDTVFIKGTMHGTTSNSVGNGGSAGTVVGSSNGGVISNAIVDVTTDGGNSLDTNWICLAVGKISSSDLGSFTLHNVGVINNGTLWANAGWNNSANMEQTGWVGLNNYASVITGLTANGFSSNWDTTDTSAPFIKDGCFMAIA